MAVVFNGGLMGGGGTNAVPYLASKTLVNATPTSFAEIALLDPTSTAGEVLYRVVAVKDADRQVLCGRFRYTGTRSGATYAESAAEAGGQTASMTAGTLAGTITVTAAAGKLTFAATFTSSLAAPAVTLFYTHDYVDGIGLVAI